MKILITGANGFIGSHLVEALSQEHELLTPDHVEMNLRHGAVIDDYIHTHLPDVVIHLAAKTEVAFSFDDYEDFQRVNYIGTVLLAEANRSHNPNMKQFIFSSTMETYGEQPDFLSEQGLPFLEGRPQNPMAPYAVAKVACEKYLDYMRTVYKFPSTILRQTNTYGRTNTDFFVMERIITQMLAGGPVKLGEKGAVRNFLFIDDLVDLYRAVLNNPRAIGETFVTGPNNPISIGDLAHLCANLIGYTGTAEWWTQPKRAGEVFYLNSDAAKAKSLLGWEPKWGLEDGICETISRIETVTLQCIEKEARRRASA